MDFAIFEKDHTVLLEAKAIEASPTVRTTASGETLGKRLSDSLLKAIIQGRETAKSLSINLKPPELTTFLVVITYKQLYLSTGDIIRDCISSEIISQLETDLEGVELIPLSNIFVFSSSEFERLTFAVSRAETTYSEFLRVVRERQEVRSKCRFTISQHLDSERYFQHPDCLKNSLSNPFGGD
ncbi:MAG: hypothetical protein EON58_10905 [Alphaproteobacteria bacterium]|nr:MAG: hypothetical protein EON58_10905 [Alphaproteobacteria bacterium]